MGIAGGGSSQGPVEVWIVEPLCESGRAEIKGGGAICKLPCIGGLRLEDGLFIICFSFSCVFFYLTTFFNRD